MAVKLNYDCAQYMQVVLIKWNYRANIGMLKYNSK